jgi:hypothetical protein
MEEGTEVSNSPKVAAAELAGVGQNRQVTRVNSTNVLDEGLRIGGRGRRMNSKVNV